MTWEQLLTLLPDNFVPPLTAEHIDLHVNRTAILRSLHQSLEAIYGDVLDVGAGHQPYRKLFESLDSTASYTPLDLADNANYSPSAFSWDGVRMPFEDDSFDTVILTEVLEHCPQPEITLAEVRRVLRPESKLFLTVPFLWPTHDCPHDEYRYTPWSLERHLRNCGFAEVQLWPTGGWDAALAQTIGLWLGRRRIRGPHRKLVTRMGMYAMRQLLKRDDPPAHFTNRSLLFPGIAGLAS